jgi:hypothetical protein
MEDDEMLLLVLLVTEQLDQNPLDLSFQSTLDVNSCRLRQGKIRRLALHHPNELAFVKLFDSGQDDALITMCGFDHASFASLHAKFEIEFDKYMPYSRDGRIRKLPTQHHEKRCGRPCLLSLVCSLIRIDSGMDQNPRFLCGFAGNLWPYPWSAVSLGSIFTPSCGGRS